MPFGIIVTPLRCGDECKCHYSQIDQANMFSCRGSRYNNLPPQVPNYTNWILFEETNITDLCGTFQYFNRQSNVTYLSFKHGNVKNICHNTLNDVLYDSNIKWIDITNNRMSEVPRAFASSQHHLKKLWLSKNPLECNCEMTWLIDWLAGEGQKLVQDYKDVRCMRGQQIGKAVYLLKPIENMGCIHPGYNLGITVSIFGAVITILMIAFAISIHHTDMRWFVYKTFGKLLGDPDKGEDISILQFDAFLSFT